MARSSLKLVVAFRDYHTPELVFMEIEDTGWFFTLEVKRLLVDLLYINIFIKCGDFNTSSPISTKI